MADTQSKRDAGYHAGMPTELRRVTVDGHEHAVTLDLAGGKVELDVDGHVAMIAFRLNGPRLAAVHTEVPAALRGKRIGDELARGLLDYAREQGMAVEPHCPFVAAFIKRHAEYADLVPADFVG